MRCRLLSAFVLPVLLAAAVAARPAPASANIFDDIGDAITDTAKKAFDGFKSLADKLADLGKKAASAVSDAFGAVVNGDLFGGAKALVRSFGHHVNAALSEAIDKGKSFSQTVLNAAAKKFKQGLDASVMGLLALKRLGRFTVDRLLDRARYLASLGNTLGGLLAKSYATVREAVKDAMNRAVGTWQMKLLAGVQAAGKLTELANAAAKRLIEVGDTIRSGLEVAWDKTVELAKKVWEGLKWLAEFLKDELLEIVAASVDMVLSPALAALERDADAPRSGLAASSRRAPAASAECGSFMGFDLSSNIQNLFKTGAMVAVLEKAKSAVSQMWNTFKSSGQLAATLKKNPASIRAAGRLGASSSLKQMVKSALVKSVVAGAAFGNIALHLATFPVGYGTAWAFCKGEKSEANFKKCYEKEFVDEYSRLWLWEGIVSTVLAPLDATVIMPLSIKVGVTVTAAVAAALASASAGLGAVAGAGIGALVTLGVKVGITAVLGMLAKKAFFGLYERSVWSAARAGFVKAQGEAPSLMWSAAK